MSTINISLPRKQANLIDSLVDKYGFANRSEFVRSIIRLVIYQPQLVTRAATFLFISPPEESAKKIASGFSKNKNYSKEFIKDLEEGLNGSNYFKP